MSAFLKVNKNSGEARSEDDLYSYFVFVVVGEQTITVNGSVIRVAAVVDRSSHMMDVLFEEWLEQEGWE